MAVGTMTIWSMAVALVVALAADADAHSWYTGKNDPETGFGCCGGNDCAEIAAADVNEVQGGYLYKPTGEFIPMSRVQQSHDWRFHRCVYLGNIHSKGVTYEKGDTRCFFAPPGAM